MAARNKLLVNIDEIRLIDEVLTSAALLATSTGDPAYKERYFDHVHLLDPLLSQSMALFDSTEARQMLARTEAANRMLVSIENQALAGTNGTPNLEGYEKLRSADYLKSKRRYASGTNDAFEELQRIAASEIERMRLVLMASVILSLVLGLAAIIAIWRGRFKSAAQRHRDRQYRIMRAMVGSFMDIQNNLLNNMVYFRTKLAHDLPFDAEDVSLIDKEIEAAKHKLQQLAESGIGETQDLGGIVVLKGSNSGDQGGSQSNQEKRAA